MKKVKLPKPNKKPPCGSKPCDVHRILPWAYAPECK